MKNRKKYGLDYLREQKGYLLYLLIYIFLLFVWWLCDLPWQPMAYLFLLLTVFASIQLLYGLRGYIRRRKLLEMYTRQAERVSLRRKRKKRALRETGMDWLRLGMRNMSGRKIKTRKKKNRVENIILFGPIRSKRLSPL